MAFEADRVVVELIAQNEQFDAANKASAANFTSGMADIKSSGAAAEGAVGQFSSALKANRLEMNQSRVGMLEFQHIARGVSDQFASGGLSTQLFTSHIGELSEAVILSGGAFGKLGLFLQGPWGIALTLAGTAIATLIASHRKEGDTLDSVYDKLVKHKEQTALNAQAEDIWSHSIDGLIDRSKKLDDQLQKRLETQTDLQRKTLSQAQTDFAAANAAAAKVETNPQSSQKEVDDAEAAIHRTSLALHDAQVLASREAGDAIASITQSAKTWADEQLHAIAILQTAHPELAEKPVADEIAASFDKLKDAIDQAASANLNFDSTAKATNALNMELANGTITVATYDQKIQGLAKSLRDAAEAAKNAPQAINDFKKAIIGAEGTGQNQLGSSAAGFGQFMPSTFESYFKQLYPQQAAGMSSGQIDALRNNRAVAEAVISAATNDYVKVLQSAGQQITAASLYTVHLLGAGDARKLFAAAPDTQTSSFLSAAVLRGNPFLRGTAASARGAIAKRIGDSSGAVSSGASALAQAQIEAEKKAAEQQAAFTSESDRLNQELLKARESQVKDAFTQLDFQEDEVRAEQQKRDDSYKSAVTTGKLTQAEADALTVLSATVAAEKIKALETQKQIEIIKQADEASERDAQFAQDNLRAAEQAATSQAQRRDLDLQILDILYNEKLAHLERLKLIAEGNNDLTTANALQAQIDQLPTQKANDRAAVLRQTLDPLQQWLQTVPHDAHAVTEALQGIAVNGFDTIASSIAGVITGTTTLGQAFASLAQQVIGDLVQMTVKMLIFRALSSALGGSFGIPDLAGNSPVDLGFQGSLFNAGPDLSSFINIPTLAGGGSGVIRGKGGVDTNLLSLNGQPVAWVSQNEGLTITPNNATAASPYGGGNGMVLVSIEASEYFDGRVMQVTGPVIASASTRAAQGGSVLARERLSRDALHTLR